nr:MAG TPA: hypothetical protein [Caudoviricetes sp.]
MLLICLQHTRLHYRMQCVVRLVYMLNPNLI